jgi:hypothetical protein
MDSDNMTLTDRNLEQIGDYVRAHLVEWLPATVLELGERIVRVEEELKAQRELMIRGFEQVDRRLEQVDKRFEQVDKRFEQVDKRFDQINKRFEEQDARFERRFRGQTWLIGTGFVLVSLLMSLYTFFA